MSYKMFTIAYFDKQLKRLIKKYPSLKSEFSSLIISLEIKPDSGTSIGNDCYKIRIAMASKGKGKSGGARIITYVQFINEAIYFLSIYDKSDQENINDKDIDDLKKTIK